MNMDLDADKIPDGLEAGENYFGSLESKILNRLHEETEVSDKKGDGLIANERYFESLEDKIFDRLEKKERSDQPRVKILWNRYWHVAASLTLLIIAAGVSDWSAFFQSSNDKSAFENEQLVSSFVEENIYFITEGELKYLLDEELETMGDDFEIPKQELEAYLLTQDIY